MAKHTIGPDMLEILGLDAGEDALLDVDRLRVLISGRRRVLTRDAADPKKRAEAISGLKRLQALEAGLDRQASDHPIASPGHRIDPLLEAGILRRVEIALAGRSSLSTRQRESLQSWAIARGCPPSTAALLLSKTPAPEVAPARGDLALPIPSRSPSLDPAELAALHEGIGQTSLYSWLGLPKDAPVGMIIPAARRLRDVLRRGPIDQFEAIEARLKKRAQQLLDSDFRARYDNALFNRAVAEFVEEVDLVLEGEVTTHDQVDYLANRGLVHHLLSGEEIRQCLASRMAALGASLLIRAQDVQFREELTRLAGAALRIDHEARERQRRLDEYGRAIRRRRLFEAESLLGRLEEAGITSDDSLSEDLNRRLAWVRKELSAIDELRRAPGSAIPAMNRYASLLEECADCPQALLSLRTLRPDPPPPPMGLEVSCVGRNRRVTWRAAGPHPAGHVYQILRRTVDRQAAGIFEPIRELSGNEYVDIDSIQPGSLVEYTVRAIHRGSIRVLGREVHQFEVASNTTAAASVLTWEEVSGLVAVAGPGSVEIRIQDEPRGCRQVLVERWAGGPDDRPASPVVLPASGGVAIDDVVPIPGQVMTYHAFAIYDGPDGQFRTPGTHWVSRVSPGEAASRPADPTIAAPPSAAGLVSEPAARMPTVSSPKIGGRSSRLVWRYPAAGPPASVSGSHRGCPAVDRMGRIFAVMGPDVVALNPDGSLAWRHATDGHIPGSPVIGPDGSLRVHSGDGKLHCLDADGRPRWEPVAIGEPLGWSSPLVTADGVAWISAAGGGLLRVGPDGVPGRRPFFRSMQRFDSTGAICGNILHIGAEDACVYAIDLGGSKGRNVWDPLADEGRTGWFVNSSLAIDGKSRVIVASRDERLYAFQSDGKPAWSREVGGLMLGSPVIDADDRIYLTVSTPVPGHEARCGKLACLDGSTGEENWTFATAEAAESTPVIGDDGVIYFGDDAGRVHAVDSRGIAAWSDPLGSPIRSAGTIAAPHLLVFGLDDGSLIGLECSSTGLAGGWPKLMGNLPQVPVRGD